MVPCSEANRRPQDIAPYRAGASVFDTEELTSDEDFALQFQAITKMPDEQKAVIKQLIEGMIIKYETQRWATSIK